MAGGGGSGSGASGGTRPHPGLQASTVLLFVVGGVSLEEARAVRAEVEAAMAAGGPGAGAGAGAGADKQLPRLLLGGTSLLSPREVCRQLLA